MLQSLFLYFGSYTCITELILVLRILYLHFGTYACISNLILVLHNLYLFYRYGSTRRYYRDSLYGSTHRYYWTYTYITELILILPIQKYSYILQRFFLYKSTRRYYRTDTEVPVGTFRTLPYSFLYSYSLFRVLSYNCLTTQTNHKK